MRYPSLFSCFPQSIRVQRRNGAALLIVLAFVVLVTGMVVAFFSRTITDRKVSNSSASQVQVELLAQSALETLLCDLKQEIADGSNSQTVTGGTIYTPLKPANAVPALVGSTGVGGLENLVKRSTKNTAFYADPAAPNRVSPASSTGTSANGRYCTAARWNAPLLLPATSGTDLTPKLTSGSFTAPDWVLVNRSSGNPTTWNSNMKWSATGTTAVIGRYAYAIYNEGGLLDMNVAGYPSSAATSGSVELARKGALAFADLTQLPLTSGSLSQADVDKLIAWRNASTASSGTDYLRAVANNTTGFLTVSSTNDHAFLSRQELIRFLTGTATLVNGTLSLSKADGQNLLQYLSTFSRDLNQPSFAPDPTRPLILGTGATYDSANDYVGGNNQYLLDDVANPNFAALRVSSTFARNDGSIAQPGEPLVKKRFALNRLAWLTCKGPSASRDTAATSTTGDDADIGLLKQANITREWLDQGTDANILKYFGLAWDNTNKRWSYGHGDPGNGICCLPELVTGIVDPKRGNGTIAGAPREPDFFELIKAAINVGSLGKACVAPVVVQNGYNALRDTNVDEQIIQIGANIIDQFDADGYPTRIWYSGATGSGHEFRGIEDLPYIYRVRTHAVQLGFPNPNISGSAAYNSANKTVYNGSTWVPFVSTGTAACILLPELWNPHDASRPLPAMMPAEFHLTTDTTDPEGTYTYGKVSCFSRYSITVNKKEIDYDSIDKTALNTPNYDPALFQTGSNQSALYGSGANQNNDLQFNVTDSRQFREPTALFIPGLPAGSNLRYGPKDWVVGGASFGTKTPVIPLNADKSGMIEAVSNNPYLGICIGVAPMAWIASISGTDASGKTIVFDAYVRMESDSPRSAKTDGNTITNGIIPTDGGITHHLWYQDPFGILRIYDEKYSGYSGPESKGFVPGESGFGWHGDTIIPGTIGTPRIDGQGGCLMVFTDPRTRRWGSGMLNSYSSCPIIAQSTTKPYPVPSPVIVPWRLNEKYPGPWGRNETFNPYDATGWYPANHTTGNANHVLTGLLSQNNPAAPIGNNAPNSWNNNPSFYCDPDGVARRAMGGYVPFDASNPATTPIGLPNVVASVVDPVTALCSPATSVTSYQPASGGSGFSVTVSPGQNLGRPIILNRPFKTVGELAYTFSDTPWRNLDLSTPESGNTALLDVFCIPDDTTPDAIVAGKVNLNTRQVPVLKALLAGAAKQDDGAMPMSAADINSIANALVTRTTGSNTAGGQGPLCNPAELVGRYVSGTPSTGANSTGTGAIYHGFSEDIAVNAPSPLVNVAYIQRFRETPIRALSNVGATRVWNLMIDLIAQTGRYPQSASGPDQFLVEGEKRYWLHVAIDRCTGAVIDQQLEPVSE